MNAQSQVENSNLAIWQAVSKTDPKHTKKVNQRGGFTAINAHSQIMEATRQFGPLGIGWGYEAGEFQMVGTMIIVPVTLWHGERGNRFGPIYGCAEMMGNRPDHDAPKKATTDAITKGLSQLGFNADVFLGLYDDNKYVEQVTAEFAEADSPTAVKGISKIKERLRAMMTAGNAPDVTLEAFNELVHASADDLTAIKDGQHMLWTGDGQDWEGFKSWIVRRREELSQPDEGEELCNVLIATLKLCDTKQALTQWLTDNGDTVEQLDGAASRKFQLAYDLQASNINEVKENA